jgi:predicted PurR-regulated permease PerM
MQDLPFAGESLTQLWQQLVHGGIPGIIDRFESFLANNSAAVIKQIQGFSDILLHLILTIVVASFFYSIGDRVMATVHDLIRRNLGVEASNYVKVISDATRSVAFGVVGSAAITACVVAIGLSIAGIPHALALSSAAFASALLMIGPLLILIPVIIWVIFQGSIGWSIFIIAWTLFTVFFDEWITAALIKGGTKMPGVMTFFGIMGGVTCFGVIGVFLGPVILETAYVVSSILIKKNLQPDANT